MSTTAWAMPGRAFAYEKQGNRAKAVESYGRALIVDPANRLAHEGQNRLGRV